METKQGEIVIVKETKIIEKAVNNEENICKLKKKKKDIRQTNHSSSSTYLDCTCPYSGDDVLCCDSIQL